MFISELNPKQMTEEQKQWFALALCEGVMLQEDISTEKIEDLQKTLSLLTSEEQVNTLIQSVKEKNLPPSNDLEIASRKLQSLMLIELTTLIAKDHHLGIKEMQYLFRIGKKLGFAKGFVQTLIRWEKEGILWQKKIAYLLQSESTLEEHDLS